MRTVIHDIPLNPSELEMKLFQMYSLHKLLYIVQVASVKSLECLVLIPVASFVTLEHYCQDEENMKLTHIIVHEIMRKTKINKLYLSR